MKNSKRSKVDPFIVMDVMENARKAEERGEDIIHMEVGQPGTAAPKKAQNELIQKMNNDSLGYTVQTEGSMIVGFNMESNYIPANSWGVLLYLEYDSISPSGLISLTNTYLGNQWGNNIPATFGR